mgnify:CR=1 FL=1|jgi:hypothetical protein|tara:strand:+ start:674 stop:937 length:264 start_codon:yes stop_codon:yes gene_type:complete
MSTDSVIDFQTHTKVLSEELSYINDTDNGIPRLKRKTVTEYIVNRLNSLHDKNEEVLAAKKVIEQSVKQKVVRQNSSDGLDEHKKTV